MQNINFQPWGAFKCLVSFFTVILLSLQAGYCQEQTGLFNNTIQCADLIFTGTVDSIYYNLNGKQFVTTNVVFRNVNVITASERSLQKNSAKITLKYMGGTFSGKSCSFSGSPSFSPNKTYLIFALDDGLDYISPLVNGNGYLLNVITDSMTREKYLTNVSGKIITEINKGTLHVSSGKLANVKAGVFTYSSDENNLRGYYQVAPSSESKAKAGLSNLNPDGNLSPLTLDKMIGSVLKIRKEKDCIRQKPGNDDSQGKFYYRDDHGEIKEKELPSLIQKGKTGNIPDSITNNSSKSPSNGTLGACGYQVLPLVMEQVPESWWSFPQNNDIMWTWNQFMNVYLFTYPDGTIQFGNAQNEFCGWMNDSQLFTYCGAHWGGSSLGVTILASDNQGLNCTRIYESDIIFNSAISWTTDLDFSLTNSNVILYKPTAIHETGHSWGEMDGIYHETYGYDVLTVMQGNNYGIAEDGMGIHSNDAYLIRRQYVNQTAIQPTKDVGVESYWANPNISSFNLQAATSDKGFYYPGDSITLSDVTVENMSYNSVSDLRIRFYLSTISTISTFDYQLGGNNQDWDWTTFPGEAWYTGNFSTTVPSDIPAGEYYIGAIVTINGFDADDYSYNNSVRFTSIITIGSLPQYSIIAQENPPGSGSITGAGTYTAGQTVQLDATPDPGWNFINWTENDTIISDQQEYIFIANTDRSLQANFELNILSISAIQGFADTSPYLNQVVAIQGIVTFVTSNGYFIQDLPGNWNGIFIIDNHHPETYDKVSVIGTVIEIYSMTKINNVSFFGVLSTGNNPPDPANTNTGSVSEADESILVRVTNANCMITNNGYSEWIVDDETGTCIIGDMFFPYQAQQNSKYNITGIVIQEDNIYKLEPRNISDIVLISNQGINDFKKKGISVTINHDHTNLLISFEESFNCQDLSFQLYDEIGRILPSDFTKSSMVNNVVLNVPQLINGLYFLRIHKCGSDIIIKIII